MRDRVAPADGSEHLAARVVFLIGAVLYPLWQPLYHLIDSTAVDPLWERLAVSAVCVALFGSSFVRRFRPHVIRCGEVAVYAGVTHFFSLAYRNHLAEPYALTAFVLLPAVTIAFPTVRSVLAFSLFSVTMSALVSGFVEAPTGDRIMFGLGVFSAQAMLTALTWRNVAIAAARSRLLEGKIRELEEARRHVRQLEGLLPICMHCRRIREGSEWQKLESYVEKHSQAVFSHGLCNDCMDEHHA
jgi:hypothetical protein